MTLCPAHRKNLIALAISALTLSLAGGAAADAADDQLLDILLDNGSITKEQYDHLKSRDVTVPDDRGKAPAAVPLPPRDADGQSAGKAVVDGTGSAAGSDEEKEAEPWLQKQIADAVAKAVDEDFPVKASYGSKGFRLETRDGNWQTNLQWRFQFRLTHPYTGDPRQVSSFADDDNTSFQARRLRMKIGGHGYRPWLKYYFEVDLQPLRDADDSSVTTSARVIDWRVDVAKFKKAGLRVGQWKVDYNRERVDSSGRQEFVERSIVNRIFTVDRQIGLQLRGRLFDGTPADLRYYAGVFNGQGRGVLNDDSNMMYVGRLQWNFLGRDLGLRQTDVERTEHPTGSLAVGAAGTIGRCTRWSSSGCGNLDGFTNPVLATDGQFKVQQAVQEFAFKWQGFSTQQEFHWKRIIDRGMNTQNDLYGTYAQLGYFFNEICEKFPEPLEFAFRYAWLREPNQNIRAIDNVRQEFTAAANWFFAGHNNKITFDYSYLTLEDDTFPGTVNSNRIRLQWDVSF